MVKKVTARVEKRGWKKVWKRVSKRLCNRKRKRGGTGCGKRDVKGWKKIETQKYVEIIFEKMENV